MDQALGDSLSPEDKASFAAGVARLNKQKVEIFNQESLPALKPVRDVKITSDFRNSKGYVSVRIRTTKDSGHLKDFWFTLTNGKWILTRSSMSPWTNTHPPKVAIEEDLSQGIQQKVKACFDQP